jgi:hypothetical protein
MCAYSSSIPNVRLGRSSPFGLTEKGCCLDDDGSDLSWVADAEGPVVEAMLMLVEYVWKGVVFAV